MKRVLVCFIVLSLVLTGCSWFREAKPKKKTDIRAFHPSQLGKSWAKVNESPMPGDELYSSVQVWMNRKDFTKYPLAMIELYQGNAIVAYHYLENGFGNNIYFLHSYKLDAYTGRFQAAILKDHEVSAIKKYMFWAYDNKSDS